MPVYLTYMNNYLSGIPFNENIVLCSTLDQISHLLKYLSLTHTYLFFRSKIRIYMLNLDFESLTDKTCLKSPFFNFLKFFLC